MDTDCPSGPSAVQILTIYNSSILPDIYLAFFYKQSKNIFSVGSNGKIWQCKLNGQNTKPSMSTFTRVRSGITPPPPRLIVADVNYCRADVRDCMKYNTSHQEAIKRYQMPTPSTH